MNDQQQVIDAIPEINFAPGTQKDRFTTVTGIEFQLKPVPPFLMMDASRTIPPPPVPQLPNFDKDPEGRVLEENPNDPQYLRAMATWRDMMGELSNGILVSRGTSILSIPEGIDKPEDKEWASDVSEFAGLKVPEVGRRRYYAWMKYVALTVMDDYTKLIQKISALSGMTMEVDVAKAAESFRSDQEGDTAFAVRSPEEDGRGHTGLTLVARDGAGVGEPRDSTVRPRDVEALDGGDVGV